MVKLHPEVERDIGIKKVSTKQKELQSMMKQDEEAVGRCYNVLASKIRQLWLNGIFILRYWNFWSTVNAEVLKFLKNHFGSHPRLK